MIPGTRRTPYLAFTLCALLVATTTLRAGDWTNNGGNAARNGLSDEIGPSSPTVHWDGAPSSIIAWQPMVVGQRVFVVRQTGFPPGGEPNGSPVVCLDLDTGAELWTRNIPFQSGDWTTWIAGHSNGQVYAGRSGNGGTVSQVLYALDEATGDTLWMSADPIDPGPYDGVVFAPDGDLIVGNAASVRRISAADGSTLWDVPRVCNVTSSCGVAVFDDGVYVTEPAPGFMNVIRKLDLATGASLYETPPVPGFTLQNTPFVGPDGTLYLSRTQNNPVTDFFYAWDDTGTALVPRWNVPAGWSTASEYGCGPDGSVYMLNTDWKVQRLDSATGAVLDTSPDPIYSGSGGPSPHFAIDAAGRVFVSNGGFANGRLYAFDADLTPRWSMPVTNINQGGPALGQDGTLVMAGVGTNLIALRSEDPWTDLGGGIAGINGVPQLTGDGSLVANTPAGLTLTDGPPSSLLLAWLSFAPSNIPYFGGTVFTLPFASQFFFATDPGGQFAASTTWPAGVPAGTGLWFQCVMQDVSVVQGITISNGLKATTP